MKKFQPLGGVKKKFQPLSGARPKVAPSSKKLGLGARSNVARPLSKPTPPSDGASLSTTSPPRPSAASLAARSASQASSSVGASQSSALAASLAASQSSALAASVASAPCGPPTAGDSSDDSSDEDETQLQAAPEPSPAALTETLIDADKTQQTEPVDDDETQLSAPAAPKPTSETQLVDDDETQPSAAAVDDDETQLSAPAVDDDETQLPAAPARTSAEPGGGFARPAATARKDAAARPPRATPVVAASLRSPPTVYKHTSRFLGFASPEAPSAPAPAAPAPAAAPEPVDDDETQLPAPAAAEAPEPEAPAAPSPAPSSSSEGSQPWLSRRLVDHSFVDERGFIETRKVWVDGAAEAEAPPPPPPPPPAAARDTAAELARRLAARAWVGVAARDDGACPRPVAVGDYVVHRHNDAAPLDAENFCAKVTHVAAGRGATAARCTFLNCEVRSGHLSLKRAGYGERWRFATADEASQELAAHALALDAADAGDDVACGLCGSGDDAATLLLCDGCDAGAAHTGCLGLSALPDVDWFCPACGGAPYDDLVCRPKPKAKAAKKTRKAAAPKGDAKRKAAAPKGAAPAKKTREARRPKGDARAAAAEDDAPGARKRRAVDKVHAFVKQHGISAAPWRDAPADPAPVTLTPPAAAPPQAARRTPDEIAASREAALERRRQRESAGSAAPAPARRTPDEIDRKRRAAVALRDEKKRRRSAGGSPGAAAAALSDAAMRGGSMPRWPAVGERVLHRHNDDAALEAESVLCRVTKLQRCGKKEGHLRREYRVAFEGCAARDGVLLLAAAQYAERWRFATPNDVARHCGGLVCKDEEAACFRCKGLHDEDLMLLCDGCDEGAAHIYCLDPPLSSVPAEDESWFCAACAAKRRSTMSRSL